MNMVDRDAFLKVRLAGAPTKARNAYAMNHLINAALIDHGFCTMLLKDPSSALAQGYYGEQFDLAPQERQFVMSVEANSLPEFADRWIQFNNA